MNRPRREKNPANLKVRNAIKQSGLYQWEVAELLGIADVTFCRWLRKELPEEEQERITQLIKEEQERITQLIKEEQERITQLIKEAQNE